MAKTFTIKKVARSTFGSSVREYTSEGTLQELVEAHRYTLETGASYEYEKGNKKINCNPKSISALINNLNKAVNNSAANGYSGVTYSLEA